MSADAPKAGAQFAGWTGDVAILGEPIFTHYDRDHSIHGGDDNRDLHHTSSEISSGIWPSVGGVVL